MSLSSFRVHQDATGQQSSASTENTDEHPPPIGCRCHRSACNKTRPDTRTSEKSDEHPPQRRGSVVVIVPRAKKSVPRRTTPTPSVCGRMSLSSFRVHQDATGQQGSASTEKSDEHPPSRADSVGCATRHNRQSSFRVQQDTTGQQSSASTEKR
ncbi:hypothetical protein TNCV_1573491 [Trichonephila clavipes]|nr:hypothetical protein TNCV_1573491 [Trichonephila clavipes]